MSGTSLAQKAVQYQKTATENTFEIISIIQNSANDALQQSIEQCSWLPEQGKQGYNQWLSYCFTATDDLKELIDGCYHQLEQQFSSLVEEGAKPVEKKTAKDLPKGKPAAIKKTTAVKTKETAAPTSDKNKAETSSTLTSTVSPKTAPAKANRSSRKKAVTKTPRVTRKARVKETSSSADSLPTTATASLRKEAPETSPAIKESSVVITKPQVERNPKVTTPLVGEKKNTLKSS